MDPNSKHDRWWNSLNEWKRLTYLARLPGEPLEDWMVKDLRSAGFEPTPLPGRGPDGAELYTMPEPPATYLEYCRAVSRGDV